MLTGTPTASDSYSFTVTATDALRATGSQAYTVGITLANTLSFTAFDTPRTAGTAQSVTITVLNAAGATATNYLGTIYFSSSDGKAGLPADYTFTAADKGKHTFSITLKTAGSQTVTFPDTVNPMVNATTPSLTVNPTAAKTFTEAGFPSSAVAGESHNVTVTTLDASGNVATGYRGTVKVTSSGSATLPAKYKFTAADNGSNIFSVALKTAGLQSIKVADTATASLAGTQTGILVAAADAQTLAVTGFPTPTMAGVPQTFTVTARDAFGNVADGYQGAVHFTSSDTKADLPDDYLFTAGDAGVHVFTASAALATPGVQSLTATDIAAAAVTGTQARLTVNAAAASTYRITGLSAAITAGVAKRSP